MLSADRPAMSGVRYDLADYINPEAVAAASGGSVRVDAAGSAFFLRDLTEVMGRTFDIKYPDLKARSLFPVFTGVDPGAEGYVWRSFDRRGGAKVITDYAADMPSAETVGVEYQARCLSLGTSYQYSIQDLNKSRMAGIPLETRKALAARRAMEEAFETIAFFGVAQFVGGSAGNINLGTNGSPYFAPATPNGSDPLAMYGITNFPAISALSLVTTTTNNWSSGASVTDIVNDFNALFLQVLQQSNGVHQADTVVMPLSTWTLLMQMQRSTTFTDDTVLQYIKKINPWLKNIYWTPMLEFAGLKQNGSTPGPLIICYERNSENVELVVPQEFEQLPPQLVNYTYKVPCHMRVGGIRVSYPKAFRFLQGFAG
jgi:hypothetical protein